MKYFWVFVIQFLLTCENYPEYSSLKKEQSDGEFLLKSINPNDSAIQYWEINKINLLTPKTIYFTGRKNLEPSLKEREKIGFFQGCQPLHCAYNIIYFKNDKWHLVTSEYDLKNFMGKIDNEFEAFLIAKINNFSIDNINEEGNGFLISDNDFFLKVMKYKSCPVSKESFLLQISTDGKIKTKKSLGHYYKSTDCITY